VRRPIVVAPAWAARLAARAAVAVAERTGKPPLATPASVAIMARELRADCGKAVRELGIPQTPVSVALRDAFAWWTREGYMPEISRQL
jgi:dihydroflavonol-4-reductase